MAHSASLTDDEMARYEWQMWSPDLGKEGQERLKASTVLVSRVGGVGGTVACYLAAAGVGRILITHAGNVKPGDLNRQILMTTDWLGKPRVESACRRLRALNPEIEIIGLAENINRSNASGLVKQSSVVVDAAPLFEERFAMNDACLEWKRPLVECAMFDFTAQLTTLIPGKTACLRCLYPEVPEEWKREFPVLGAVSGTVACMAAVEVIKLITGIDAPLAGEMLLMNLRSMSFRKLPILRRPDCRFCGNISL
ncbi:MAG: HesA/MoeB/ThiF family protein [Planctomycetaceae bacterium]|nr:HesA/MoeB/ThiF family protein [Planctomycetaceae bacterium]